MSKSDENKWNLQENQDERRRIIEDLTATVNRNHELLTEARNDITECIDWIHAEMNNEVQVPMRREDWNWLLARLKASRTYIVNELKRKEG